MIIVSGKLKIKEGERKTFLDSSKEAMEQARKTPGCRDFIVAADPLDPHRVNIYEEWETKDALIKFRGAGPDDAMIDLIIEANVTEHGIGK